jgi:hypothetical protein
VVARPRPPREKRQFAEKLRNDVPMIVYLKSIGFIKKHVVRPRDEPLFGPCLPKVYAPSEGFLARL